MDPAAQLEVVVRGGKGLRPGGDSVGQMCPVRHTGQHSEGHEPGAQQAWPLQVSRGIPKKDRDLSTVQILER